MNDTVRALLLLPLQCGLMFLAVLGLVWLRGPDPPPLPPHDVHTTPTQRAAHRMAVDDCDRFDYQQERTFDECVMRVEKLIVRDYSELK